MILDPNQMEELPELPPLEDDRPPRPPRSQPGPKKPGKAASTSSASSSASAKRNPISNLTPAWEKEIYRGVTETLVATGAIAHLAMPVTGTVMISRAPTTADALIRIARRDERVRNALLAMLRYSAYAELAMVLGAIVLAVMVDRGQLPPEHPVAGILIGQEIKESGVLEHGNQPAPAAGNGQQPAWVGAPRTGGAPGDVG